MRLAQFLRAHCLLVADIERGGVFAQLVGTLDLLRPVERPLIRGLLINRFRGRRELFDSGRSWLVQHTAVPVLGVMPWLDELFPPEDSLDLLERRGRKAGAELEIAAGYSHPVVIQPRPGISFEVPAPTQIVVKGINKQQVGQTAAEIRAVRPPEPYKGKGIRYEGEVVRRKVGKRA